jgi:hypothetical protein
MVMPYIEGTVTVGGNPITTDVDVQCYDLTTPSYWPILPGGPDLLDWDEHCPVSLVDGSYTLPDLVFGHSYLVVVQSDDVPPEVKVTFWGDVTNAASSVPVVITGVMSNIDIDCLPGDGTHPSGVTYNSPHNADYVEVMFCDPDMWVFVGGAIGYPDGPFDMGVLAELHATESYRICYLALDGGGVIDSSVKLYNNKSWTHYSQAGTVLGDASNLRLNFGGYITAIPMGSGAHFSIPRRRK